MTPFNQRKFKLNDALYISGSKVTSIFKIPLVSNNVQPKSVKSYGDFLGINNTYDLYIFSRGFIRRESEDFKLFNWNNEYIFVPMIYKVDKMNKLFALVYSKNKGRNILYEWDSVMYPRQNVKEWKEIKTSYKLSKNVTLGDLDGDSFPEIIWYGDKRSHIMKCQ